MKRSILKVLAMLFMGVMLVSCGKDKDPNIIEQPGEEKPEVQDKDLNSIKKIVAGENGFTVLYEDGTVRYKGNNIALKGVSAIFSTAVAFAALTSDKKVISWGDKNYGGDSSYVTAQLENVTKIFSTWGAFAALKKNGTVVSWGKIN